MERVVFMYGMEPEGKSHLVAIFFFFCGGANGRTEMENPLQVWLGLPSAPARMVQRSGMMGNKMQQQVEGHRFPLIILEITVKWFCI